MASDSTRRPSSTTATAVSSQEDSNARIFMLAHLSSHSFQGTWAMGLAPGARGMRTYRAYFSGENRF